MDMNKKISLLIILFLGIMPFVEAQSDTKIRVKGVVLNEQTNEPVGFANIGLLGTVAGVASDMDGHFELVVPNLYVNHVLRVSAVGFTVKDIKLSELMNKGEVKILLKPVVYAIQSVEVTAESLVYKKLLERVVSSISMNYIPRPYNYEGYFKYGVSVNVNEGTPRTKEAIVTIYDKQGYKRSNPAEAFAALNYHFSQVRRSAAVSSVEDGMVYFDDVLSADVVRNTRNVLDVRNLNDFKLVNKGRFLYEGDTVQIVGYTCKKPTLSNSGSTHVLAYSGEIYINLRDAAVVKNVMRVTTKDFSVMGRNLLIPGDTPKGEVKNTIITNYKRVSSYYFLSGISVTYFYKQGEDFVKGEMQYQNTKVRLKTLKPIEGRVYFEEVPTDPAFWDRYTIYLEEEE